MINRVTTCENLQIQKYIPYHSDKMHYINLKQLYNDKILLLLSISSNTTCMQI